MYGSGCGRVSFRRAFMRGGTQPTPSGTYRGRACRGWLVGLGRRAEPWACSASSLGDLIAGGPNADPSVFPPPPCNLRCARVGALCQEPPPRSRVCHACPASRPVLCERCSTHADCALNAPPPPSLPGRVHWVVYAAAAHAMEMTARDRPARDCIASGDDRRCERGHPHIALGLGLRAAARVASLPTWW